MAPDFDEGPLLATRMLPVLDANDPTRSKDAAKTFFPSPRVRSVLTPLDENQLRNGFNGWIPWSRSESQLASTPSENLQDDDLTDQAQRKGARRKSAKDLFASIRMKVWPAKPVGNSTDSAIAEGQSPSRSTPNSSEEVKEEDPLDDMKAPLTIPSSSGIHVEASKEDSHSHVQESTSEAVHEVRDAPDMCSPTDLVNAEPSRSIVTDYDAATVKHLCRNDTSSSSDLARKGSLSSADVALKSVHLKDVGNMADIKKDVPQVELGSTNLRHPCSFGPPDEHDLEHDPDAIASLNRPVGNVPETLDVVADKNSLQSEVSVVDSTVIMLSKHMKSCNGSRDVGYCTEAIHSYFHPSDAAEKGTKWCIGAKTPSINIKVSSSEVSCVTEPSPPSSVEKENGRFKDLSETFLVVKTDEHFDRYCSSPRGYVQRRRSISKTSGTLKKFRDPTPTRSGSVCAMTGMSSKADEKDQNFVDNLPRPYVPDFSDDSSGDESSDSTSQILRDITKLIAVADRIPEYIFLESDGSESTMGVFRGPNASPREYRMSCFKWKRVDEEAADSSRNRSSRNPLSSRMLDSFRSSTESIADWLSSSSFKESEHQNNEESLDAGQHASIPWFQSARGPKTSLSQKHSVLAAAAAVIREDGCHKGESSAPKVLWTRGSWLSSKWQMVAASIITPQLFGPLLVMYPLDENLQIDKSRHECTPIRSCEVEMIRQPESVKTGLLSVSGGPVHELFCFVVTTATGKLKLAAETDEERKDWVAAFREADRAVGVSSSIIAPVGDI